MHYHLVYYRAASPKCSTQLDFKTIESLISNYDKLKARGFSVVCFKNKKVINLDEEVKTVVENQLLRDKQNKSIPMALMDKIRKISSKMAKNQKDTKTESSDDLVFEPEELSFRHEAEEVNKSDQEVVNTDLENITVVEPEVAV